MQLDFEKQTVIFVSQMENASVFLCAIQLYCQWWGKICSD